MAIRSSSSSRRSGGNGTAGWLLPAFVALHAVLSAAVNFAVVGVGMAWGGAGARLPRPASLSALEAAGKVLAFPAGRYLFELLTSTGAPRFLGDYSLMMLLVLANSACAGLCVWAGWMALRWVRKETA